jgi:ribosomal protein S18 acetylase RimI-like enzyme
MRIVQVHLSELSLLQEISKNTFEETFAAFNTKEDMTHYFEHNLSLDQLTIELESPASSFYFIYVEEELSGYMKLNISETFEIERIYILKKFQGIGVGKTFMNFAIEQSKSLGFTSLWLGVWEHNTKAISFYKSLGFITYGEHDFLLGSDLQRDILMRLELN